MADLDPETQKVQMEGEKAHYLTKSDDWQWAKRKLLQSLSNLDSVKTLDLRKGREEIAREVEVRKMVIDMVIDWIDDIEGIAQQHRAQSPNKLKLKEIQKEDYINNQEEEED